MLSEKLLQKTFDYYNHFKKDSSIVQPSLPILYFGDLEAYSKSNLKVITVGKNPSDNEFKELKNGPISYFRFNIWNPKSPNLINTLNSYFKNKPLTKWFNNFEPLLNGLNASYYDNDYDNRVLHTDICTPLATNPTWSNLSNEVKDELYSEGNKIWRDLIEELQPDIMIFSFSRFDFNKLKLVNNENTLLVFSENKKGEKRKKPYEVKISDLKLNTNKNVKVIFSPAANQPLGKITKKQREEIGRKICQV